MTYVKNSIKDLAPGSPVQIFGIEVGEVTSVKLAIDPQKQGAVVRVAFEIEPERAFGSDPSADAVSIIHQLVQNGMRVKMRSSELIVGQEILSLEFAPEFSASQHCNRRRCDSFAGAGGGVENVADALGDVAAKLDQIPFDEIGQHLNHLLASADQTIGGPEMHRAVHLWRYTF